MRGLHVSEGDLPEDEDDDGVTLITRLPVDEAIDEIWARIGELDRRIQVIQQEVSGDK